MKQYSSKKYYSSVNIINYCVFLLLLYFICDIDTQRIKANWQLKFTNSTLKLIISRQAPTHSLLLLLTMYKSNIKNYRLCHVFQTSSYQLKLATQLNWFANTNSILTLMRIGLV